MVYLKVTTTAAAAAAAAATAYFKIIMIIKISLIFMLGLREVLQKKSLLLVENCLSHARRKETK